MSRDKGLAYDEPIWFELCAQTHQNTWPWQGRGALCPGVCAARGLIIIEELPFAIIP